MGKHLRRLSFDSKYLFTNDHNYWLLLQKQDISALLNIFHGLLIKKATQYIYIYIGAKESYIYIIYFMFDGELYG